MGFLRKLFGGGKAEPEVFDLPGNGKFELEIVGESHYQNNLETICGPRSGRGENRLVQARLILDDHNPYDNQAVRVEISQLLVGHLSREAARSYRGSLRSGGHPRATGDCAAKIKGGWQRKDGDTGHYGVWLDIPVNIKT